MSDEPIDLRPIGGAARISVMCQRALDIVEASGTLVFPVHGIRDGKCTCGDAGCVGANKAGKHPLGKGWQLSATADPMLVVALWQRTTDANIGILTGRRSGIVVVDVDGMAGMQSLVAIERAYGPTQITPMAITPRGRHIYFKHPGGNVVVHNSASAVGPKIDVRGDGGYVVAPGSVHASGVEYCWSLGRALGDVELAPLPMWATAAPAIAMQEIPIPRAAPSATVLPLRADSSAYYRSAVERECTTVARAAEGTRNHALNTAAFNLGQLVAAGHVGRDHVFGALMAAAKVCDLGERESFRTIASGLDAGCNADPRRVPEPRIRVGPNGSSSSAVQPVAANDNARIQLRGVDVVFAPLAPMKWISRELMIAVGRPTLIIAYGASAKTLAMQSLLLSLCAGKPIWDHFAVGEPQRVCHLDYEQGSRDTYSRYQRLALGHGFAVGDLGDRLYVAAMPSVYLTTPDAEAELSALASGFDVVLIDSFRAAALGVDENASEVRAYIDMLTRISGNTGCAFILIHHAGKAKDDGRDQRMLGRGSSAIFDACGCVYNLTIGKANADPRRLVMAKPPASGMGKPVAAFGLVVADVASGEDEFAGVSVTWRADTSAADAVSEADRAYLADTARVLAIVTRSPGITQNALVLQAGMNRNRAQALLGCLVDEERVSVVVGPRQSKSYWPVKA
jgi:hypothetical protein